MRDALARCTLALALVGAIAGCEAPRDNRHETNIALSIDRTALDEALGVLTEGGGMAQLFAKGTELPGVRQMTIYTEKAKTRLLLGAQRGDAKTPRQVGAFRIVTPDGQTPDRKRHVRILFEVDRSGRLWLSARDQKSHERWAIEILRNPLPPASVRSK